VGDLGSCEFLPQIIAILLDKYAGGGCVTAERDEGSERKLFYLTTSSARII